MCYFSPKPLIAASSALVISLTLGATQSFADTPKNDVPAATPSFVTQYQGINDAIVKRDVDKIMSYFTDDFTETNSVGATVDREQERKQYQSEFGKIKSMNVHYSIQDCIPTPAGTYCDVKFHLDGIGFKRILFMKVQGAFTNDLIVRDLWIQTADGPRLKSRLTLLDQTKINTE